MLYTQIYRNTKIYIGIPGSLDGGAGTFAEHYLGIYRKTLIYRNTW